MSEATGILSSTGTPPATQGSYTFTIQVTDFAGNTQTQSFTLVIHCNASVTLNLDGYSLSFVPTELTASFTPANGGTLSQYAQECGFTNFDWVQQIILTPTPDGNANDEVFAEDAPSVALAAPPEFSDPPLGGYTYQFEDPSWAVFQPHFATANPYYYSSADFTTGCAAHDQNNKCVLPITSGGETLNFFDSPRSPDCSFPAPCIGVNTQLVGICGAISATCPSLGPSGPLHQWYWQTNFNSLTGTGGVSVSMSSIAMPAPGSGTGGIAVTSINGVPTPTVTVTPFATDITTTQGLVVTVVVKGASGSPTPTGSVTLTSGTYTSAATVLSGGSATISIPAGFLATGTDTVTAVYKPDNGSAATFSVSSGFAEVTVTVPLLMPTVTVTPTSSSIMSAQQLPVTIAVSGGTGDPTPTGTVTLSSGKYNSSITSLTAGTTSITIVANSLSAGSDTLTADYTPDSNSSATYGSSYGTSSPVTVTLSPPTATPTFSPGAGTYNTTQTVTISDTAQGATVYYTTNGTTPTTSSAVYGGTISVSSTDTLEAVAVAPNYSPSATASATYIISPAFTGPGIESVSAILPEQTQTITITGAGFGTHAPYSGNSADINFVDNSGVTWSAGTGTDLVGLSISSWTDSQIVLAGFTGSYGFAGWALSSGDNISISIWNAQSGAGPYICKNIIVGAGPTTCGALPAAATPTFNVAAGTYTSVQTVTITDGTPNATIYYAINGTPTTASTKYTGPVIVSSSETLEAIATATGYSNSAVQSAAYTVNVTAATPTFSVPAGTYTSVQTVTISDTTPNATIYYAINGTPTTASTKYTGPITVSSSETLEAIATATGYSNSTVQSAAYTIDLSPSSFAITGTAVAVAPGATTGNTSTITATPGGGFTGNVTLTATSNYPSADPAAPTFSFGSTSPVSITSSSTGTATLTISTTAQSSNGCTATNHMPSHFPWYSGGGAALACMLLFGIPARRRRLLSMLSMISLLIALTGGVLACGGGGSGACTPTTNPGTTAGTYAVTITGTSGATTATGTIILTVQ
jgi:hypothetical protein